MKRFLYSEEDMQVARDAMERIQKQYNDAQAVIWAIAMKNGGTLEIDQRLLAESSTKGNVLTTWNDPTELLFCIKASRPTKRPSDGRITDDQN